MALRFIGCLRWHSQHEEITHANAEKQGASGEVNACKDPSDRNRDFPWFEWRVSPNNGWMRERKPLPMSGPLQHCRRGGMGQPIPLMAIE